jgi:hypothetical protein
MDPQQFLARRQGRAYGFELLLRKRDAGRTFGWLSYTLSRSERVYEGRWVPFDFDRRHMVHLVLGLRLPRDWDVAAALQVQSGRPITTTAGYNADRAAPFFRADLRVDKRAVFGSFVVQFYVDVVNLTYAPESLDDRPESQLRYVLPTLGARAVF